MVDEKTTTCPHCGQSARELVSKLEMISDAYAIELMEQEPEATIIEEDHLEAIDCALQMIDENLVSPEDRHKRYAHDKAEDE